MSGKKYCKANIERFCELISLGNTEATACAQVGISMETFQEWMASKPRFVKAYEKAKSDIQVLATSRLLKLTGRDPRAAQYFHVQVHSDYRRSDSAPTVAEVKQAEAAKRLWQSEKIAEVLGGPPTRASGPPNGEEEVDTNGMTVAQTIDADKAARDYGAKVAREYEQREAKNLPAVPGKGSV